MNGLTYNQTKKESPISENSALLRIIAQSIIDIQKWFFSGGRQLFMCEFSQNNFFDSYYSLVGKLKKPLNLPFFLL